ncbi:MAG: polyprenyl synthetase family protein [Candidatus Omnitrophica bacterium]|nr:polyprenyl synthetase family protein [Candidatus Omnitrophota bacterium]
MFFKIRKRVEKELANFISGLDKDYGLSRISPLLSKSIKEVALRKGKRIRPTLFTIGYLGYAKKPAPGLFRSAVSLELLHDFMLVHDDIIDKSDTRRGKPSMHALLNKQLKVKSDTKFNGQDLAIIVGDVMYAMALRAFLSVNENMQRKEQAFKKLIEAALYTGSGEFIELMLSLKPIERVTKNDIYKIYDLKTANYSFSAPLVMGATLAGAGERELNKLHDYGIYLGRAFQIQDDILGMFADEIKIGKSGLTDLKEAKKTLLIWYAYNNSGGKDRLLIKKILNSKTSGKSELMRMRRMIITSKALDYVKKEIALLSVKAKTKLNTARINPKYKTSLHEYTDSILSL